jgi:hypothetical protein
MSANDLHLRTTATPVLSLSGAAVTSDDHWLGLRPRMWWPGVTTHPDRVTRQRPPQGQRSLPGGT